MKKHGDLSPQYPEQIGKSVLEDVINDTSETAMYNRKVKYLNSDGFG